jgi:hypothetical protein
MKYDDLDELVRKYREARREMCVLHGRIGGLIGGRVNSAAKRAAAKRRCRREGAL